VLRDLRPPDRSRTRMQLDETLRIRMEWNNYMQELSRDRRSKAKATLQRGVQL
jgi:hypothetical protein